MKELATYIQSLVDIPDGDLTDILSGFSKRSIGKNKFIFKAEHIATDYFLLFPVVCAFIMKRIINK